MKISSTTGVWLEKADGSRVLLRGYCALGRSRSNAVVGTRLNDRRVLIPRTATNIEVLRPLTQLEYLGWEDDGKATQTPATRASRQPSSGSATTR